MPDKLAARVSTHADTGEQAVGRAMEAALAAKRLRDAADEKDREVIRHLADASAAFSSVRAASSGPEPLPGTPANPAPALSRRASDSVRAVVVASAGTFAAGLTAWACSPYGNALRPDPDARTFWSEPVAKRDEPLSAGLQALKDDKLVKAEHEFTKSGDKGRLAEVLNRQGRYDEAVLATEHVEDGQAKLMLALAHQARGEFAEYRRCLVEARNLGNHPALRLLEQHDSVNAAAGG